MKIPKYLNFGIFLFPNLFYSEWKSQNHQGLINAETITSLLCLFSFSNIYAQEQASVQDLLLRINILLPSIGNGKEIMLSEINATFKINRLSIRLIHAFNQIRMKETTGITRIRIIKFWSFYF